jgi:hypothetical protein
MSPGRRAALYILAGWLTILATICPRSALARRDAIAPDYPRSLLVEIEDARTAAATHPSESGRQILLAELYLDLGDDLYTEEAERRQAYENGARAAERALMLDERNAQAHFLYAANRGSTARLKGLTSAAMELREIKRHIARALALQPDHAQALQMMGGLLVELPWFLGGDSEAGQHYLEQAVATDGNYTNARLLLAKVYIKQDRYEAARRELEAVVGADWPHYRYAWEKRFRPEAKRLLDTIPSR